VAGEWETLFDGKSLRGWKVLTQERFTASGARVRVERGRIILEKGRPRTNTGIVILREVPNIDYELKLDAMQLSGKGSFCTVHFLIGSSQCTLALRGYHGGDVGLYTMDFGRGSSTIPMRVRSHRWYRVRLRVTKPRVQVWVDEVRMIDVPTAEHKFSVSPHQRHVRPLGFSTYEGAGALRNIRLRRLGPEAAATARPAEELRPGETVRLFDGKTLRGWRVVKRFPALPGRGSGKGGKVRVEKGRIVLPAGEPFTGVICTRDFPATDYELCLEATRLGGKRDFCTLSFPMRGSRCQLLIGGWGGDVVGLEFVDGQPGYANATSSRTKFRRGQWYRVRLRVRDARIEAWVGRKKVVDIATAGRRFQDTFASFLSPLGVFSTETTAAVRNITLRKLGPEPSRPDQEPEPGSDWAFPGAAPDKPRRTLDLMPLIQPRRDAIKGEWTRVHETLRVQPMPGACLTLPVVPEGDYKLLLQVSRVGGPDSCNIGLPVGKGHVTLIVDGESGTVIGLGHIDRVKYYNTPTATKLSVFGDGKKHTIVAQVRTRGEKAQILIAVDGKDVIRWAGQQRSLRADDSIGPAEPKAFLVGATRSAYVFHKIQLKMLNGKARRLYKER
jgi:hypothetical protein